MTEHPPASSASIADIDFTYRDSTFMELSFDFRTISIRGKLNSGLPNSILSTEVHSLTALPHSINIQTHDRQIASHFSVIIRYDLHESHLTCTFDGSSDLFNQTTIDTFTHRFYTLCQQLFSSSFNPQIQPIYELSILLPFELHMLRKLNNCTFTSNIIPTIHQAFIQQAILHPNKIALILDDQSLTYNELLSQVQKLTFVLINDYEVHPGDILCQYIDRSIEMIIGIISIMMSGAIYAPLNPHDPINRIQSLIHQIDGKLILVNQMSHSNVTSINLPIVNISQVLDYYTSFTNIQIEQLSHVAVTPDSISHIVFTSGSTGIPKAVQIRHRNFMSYMQSHVIQINDIVLQFTSCSFDSHLDEIIGGLVRGAQLVALKSGGHFDFDYVIQTIYEKKVTYVGPVPSWLNALSKFLDENYHARERVKSVRCWYLGGKEKEEERKKYDVYLR
jgi:non-ribosomal peptide synthetase component F